MPALQLPDSPLTTGVPQAGEIVFRPTGSFDGEAAWELRRKVERIDGGEVVLDFSGVREFSDFGVAVLAHGLAQRIARVQLRGLRTHQTRLFRYFGVEPEGA